VAIFLSLERRVGAVWPFVVPREEHGWLLIVLDYIRLWQGPGGAVKVVNFSRFKVENLLANCGWKPEAGWTLLFFGGSSSGSALRF
jgi:hypothetical protein